MIICKSQQMAFCLFLNRAKEMCESQISFRVRISVALLQKWNIDSVQEELDLFFI